MPQVVNGCGTWYYGKKNLQQYQGVCRACGALTTLSSYDTRLYAVVFFVPLIPLARKRIIEQCPACTRHGAMPLDDWRRAEKRSAEAIAAYRAAPNDAERAREALAASASFRNLPQFLDLAPDVERNLARDGETLRMLAAGYHLFGRASDTERVLRMAMAAQDEDETREALADCLLRQGRPFDAEPLLRHVVEQGIPDRVDWLYRLAQGFQMKGAHEKALEAFRQCEAVNPHITQDETFVRLRDESASKLGTQVPVTPSTVVTRAKRQASFRKFQRVAPVVLAMLLVAYAVVCFVQGRRREVYLVNALHKPYTVRINGQPYTLQPRVALPVRVAEGELAVEMADAAQPVPAEKATLQTSFFGRPFSGATFVINPDHAAVLEQITVYYQSERRGSAGRKPDVTYAAGGLLHRFDGIDYAFREFPQTIKMESSTSSVSKEGLALMEEEPATASAALAELEEHVGKAAVAEVAKRHMLLEPERSEYLPALKVLVGPAELLEFLRTGLDRRPVAVNWHRAYQDALTSGGQDERAEKEYADMLAREPQDRDLQYLAGRAALDTDKALSLLRRAADEPSPSPHAHFALCGYHLANAEFDDAARHAETVLRMMPDEISVRWFCRTALQAAGRFDRVFQMLDEEQAGSLPSAVPAASEEVALRAMLMRRARPWTGGDHAGQIERAIGDIQRRIGEYGPDVVQRQYRRFEAAKSYCSGDPNRFVSYMEDSSDPRELFVAHLTAGRVDAADKCLAQDKDADAELHLLTYLAASRAGDGPVAERHLRAACELLAKGDYESRQFGKALAGEAALPLPQLLRLRMSPREKMVLLAAVGVRDAAAREPCFALARKLNFDPRFPHLLVADVLDHPPAR